jgi:5'-nucleotidase
VGAVVAAGLLVPVPASAATGADVIINEAYMKGGSSGAPYLNKFIELYNAGDTAQDLTGWSLQYRSATGTEAANSVVALTGTIQPGDYFLVQGASNDKTGATGAALPAADQVTSLDPGGQNGTLWLADTATALKPGTGNAVGTPNVVDLIGYGATNTSETSPAPDAGGTSTPNSLVRSNFADTDDNSVDITVSTTVTPQASAAAVPSPTPTDTASPAPTPSDTASPSPAPSDGPAPGITSIAQIQGAGDVSPLAGQTVTTRGVVTAAYPTGGFNGFYIQTPGTGGALDAAHTASDAVFVYGSAATAKVKVGDHVEVTGPVSEFKSASAKTPGTLTEISPSADGVTVLSAQAAAVAPASVAWPVTDDAREKLEGMLVAPQGDFTVSDTYDTNYYASIGLAAGTTPLLTPTDVARPGTAEYTATVADNAARAITLDDGASINFTSNANKGIPLPYLSTTAPVRVGAPVVFTTPVVVDYRNELWNFQPTQQLTVENAATVQPATFANTREPAPKAVGGDIQIASFNVLNYFTTTADDWIAAGGTCTVYTDRAGDPVTANNCGDGPRGAAEEEDLARQQAKIVAAINGLGAEVVSLEEIENSLIAGTDRDAAVKTLVAALNSALGAEQWAFAPSPADVPSGEDVIRTAFIYKKAAVQPVGESVIDGDAAFDNARHPLAQAFAPADGSDDDAFIAIVNHFKSKGSGDGADADQNDGQGASNASRVAQAEALVDFADELKTEVGTDEVFLLGDFNSYTQEDPMQVLYEAGYTDLAPDGEYTYSFDGAVGSLDHILASPGAAELVTGSDVWNINSVESIALEYSRYNYNATNFYDESPFRSSDHDPLVVGVDLDPTVDLNLLNINDFHGRIDANTVKFAGTIEQLRAAYGEENTLFLSDGDNIGASLFASGLQNDTPTLDVLDALELKTSAVGNHEFDKGFADLTGRVSEEADFSYLGANVYRRGTTTPALPEYATFEVQGLTVGVIGAVTEETRSLVSPGGIADLDFGDPVDAVNRVAAKLSDGNPDNGEADVIVAEYHEGAAAGVTEQSTLEEELADGKAFADIVTKTSSTVDVIFTGHTHKLYAWDAPIPGAPEKTRPVLQTGSYGENIGQVVLTVDAQSGEVESYAHRNVPRVAIVDDKDTKNDAAQNAQLDADLIAAYPRVAEVDTIVDAALAQADVIGRQQVGSVTADITTAFAGGSYVDGEYTGGTRDNRAAQSTLGNLVADSLVDSLSAPDRGAAEIGIVNPGGLRAELLYGEDGAITYAEANAVLPFVNNLWTTTLTGAQFKSVLEEQWQTNADGTVPSRSYLQLGLSENVSYTYDASAPQGSHVTGIWIDGAPIDPAAQYRIGSFSFLLQGGDNFRTLAQGADTRDSGLVDRDAWIAYLKENPGLSPEFASRSAQVSGVPASVRAGDTVSFTVSGLDLTSLGAPANKTLEARIGDTVYPPFAVSAGAATVSLTVPAGASEIVFTAPDSGTEVRVPITVLPQTEEPGTGQPGTGQPGTGVPGSGPTPPTGGLPAAVSALVSALQNLIQVIAGNLVAGGTITIHVGEQYSGHWVHVWLHSDPISLGWQQVDAAGNVTVRLPADVTGTHRLVVQDADGNVIGWQSVSIRALAATGGGGDAAGGAMLLAVLLLGAGAATRIAVRRRRA